MDEKLRPLLYTLALMLLDLNGFAFITPVSLLRYTLAEPAIMRVGTHGATLSASVSKLILSRRTCYLISARLGRLAMSETNMRCSSTRMLGLIKWG